MSYDDLVKGSKNEIFEKKLDRKDRIKFYPQNAFMVDLDNKFNYYGEEWPQAPSYSDIQVDITLPIGKNKALPQELVGQFDIVILENLSFAALTAQAFTNIWSLLRSVGLLVSNNYLSTTTLKMVDAPPSTDTFFAMTIKDMDNHEIGVFIDKGWINNFEKSSFMLYSTTAQAKENLTKKSSSAEYVKYIYQEIFKNANVEIVKDIEYWYGVPELHGYLIWKKP